MQLDLTQCCISHTLLINYSPLDKRLLFHGTMNVDCMKRTAHKKVHHVSRKKVSQKKLPPFVAFRVIAIGFAVLLLVVGIRGVSSSAHVLGANTLLAQDGGDSGDTGGDGQRGDNVQQNSGSNPPVSGGVVQPTVGAETQVDCVNPQTGQHFTTSFHDCQDINQKSDNPGFQFVPLTTPEPRSSESAGQEGEGVAQHGQLRVQEEGNKSELNLETPGLHVQLKREDNGSVHLTAQTADGREINLEANALEQLNTALSDKGVEVATSSSSINSLVIRRRGVEAETELPISVDPTTHELTVTTPAGVRTVTVLPDQAVNNLLSNKVLTSVQTAVSSTSGAITQQTTLTSLNNQPVFQVSGVNQKRLLGLIPLAFAKTAFVSAANGSVVQVNEALFNRILEALSF